MKNEKSIGEMMMEASKKLYESCPKMKNPEWWDNGDESVPEIPAEIDAKINENAKVAGMCKK